MISSMEEGEVTTTVVEGDEEQEIWSWGAGTDGQLATGRLQDEHSPQLIRSLSAFRPIVSLSCGGAHVIALTPGGRVLSWGRGTSGQLGHGQIVSSLEPKIVKGLEAFIITHVSAGWNHSGFVSESGAIFTCGDGSFGQLGHGDYTSQCYPRQVSHFASKPVEQVACGMRHSLVLLRGNVENPVYGFGSGKRGQLGISNTDKVKSTSVPQTTMGLKNLIIISIDANGDHSSALSADGSLYSWGRGFGCASDMHVPCHSDVAFPISKVALGWNHALLLTRESDVFMLGGDRHGVLGEPQKTPSTTYVRGNTGNNLHFMVVSNFLVLIHVRICDGYHILPSAGKSKDNIMQIIPGHANTKVVQIASGAEHSALVAGKKLFTFFQFKIYKVLQLNLHYIFNRVDNGSVMTWGWGEHGQLGLGNTDDQTAPQVVTLGPKFAHDHAPPRVYCGSGFSFVLRT